MFTAFIIVIAYLGASFAAGAFVQSRSSMSPDLGRIFILSSPCVPHVVFPLAVKALFAKEST